MKIIVAAVFTILSFGFAQTSFTLDPEGTEARFYIEEVLLGKDKTVIGVTSDVTADIMFDRANPATATLGTVTINARELATDDNRRNGQIQRRILQSNNDEYQFITFMPTLIEGLPEATSVGDTFELQITGDLTIKGVTNEVVFMTNVIVASETELDGLGSTIVNFKDFDISVPTVPIVTGLEEEVKLELAFKAVAQ